ncbi:hypothetical protein FB446DRAFT_744331 [Lentinula raphanica]|nr:hypothetical protein FB446DRAFT_744331 [Lentinula raphanica]
MLSSPDLALRRFLSGLVFEVCIQADILPFIRSVSSRLFLGYLFSLSPLPSLSILFRTSGKSVRGFLPIHHLFVSIFPSSVGFSQLSFWRCGRWPAFLHLSFSIIIVSYSFTTSTLIELFFI